ncbi:hypothetical protein [Streptomyces laurentii]|uniref:hypothetical protein n=1 Tax=Streptomyces laurentii TaxID=39478 RepID=UPI0033E46F00
MLNRIRRAITRTRERHAPTGARCFSPTPARLAPAAPGQRTGADLLAGEDTALVRPYVLATEERASRRSAAVLHNLVAHTCFVASEAY